MATAEKDLHEVAVSAEENLSDLATGLAQEGADQDVISTVRKMAGVMRKIVRALGPGAGQPPQEQAAPQPQAQEATPAQPQTMDAATNHLHSAMQAAAAARQGGR